MAKLRGWAVQVEGLSWEHTYVTSDDGARWGCFGRNTGGREICSDDGETDKAECMSNPRGGEPAQYAGLVYGVTGVCHQAANRVLWFTDVEVDEARGYFLSVLKYGQYGDTVTLTGKIAYCAANFAADVAAPTAGVGRRTRATGGIAVGELIAVTTESQSLAHPLDRDLESSGGRTAGRNDGGRSVAWADEAGAILRMRLGESCDNNVLVRILAELAGHRENHRKMCLDLAKSSLPFHEFAKATNADYLHALVRVEKLLGETAFFERFGQSPVQGSQLVALTVPA